MTRMLSLGLVIALIILSPLAAQSPAASAPAVPAWKAFLSSAYPDTNDVLQQYFSELITANWSRALPFGSKTVVGASGPSKVAVEDAGKLFYIVFSRGASLGFSGDRVVERNKEKAGILLQSKVFFRDGADSYVRIRPPNYATTSLDVVVYGAVGAKDIPVGQMMLYILPYGMDRIAELSAKAFDWNQVFRSAPESPAARLSASLLSGDAERNVWKSLLDALRRPEALLDTASEVVSSGFPLFAADADPRSTTQPYAPFPRFEPGVGWPLRAARALAFEGSKTDEVAFLLSSPAGGGKAELRVLLVPYRGPKGFGFAAWDLLARSGADSALLSASDPERHVRLFRVNLSGR